MKIELKKIEYSERLSEETNAFSADLYINGIKAGEAYNRGHGGPTDYHADNPKGAELITQAEDWCKSLPPKEYPADKYTGAMTIDMDLEGYIDDLVGQYLKRKFQKEMERSIKKGIVISDDPEFGFRSVEFNKPIETIVASGNGRKFLVETLVKVKGDLKRGERILNDNIPELLLKAAGLSEKQFTKPGLNADTDKAKKQQSRKRNRGQSL